MSRQPSATGGSRATVAGHPIMVLGSGLLVTAFVLFTILNTEYANFLYEAAKSYIASNLGWYYIGLVSFCLLLVGNEHPPARYRVFWGMAIGAVAAVLLFAGGLKALQTASIIAALPFSIVLILAIYGLLKSLKAEVSAASGEHHGAIPVGSSTKQVPAPEISTKSSH